MKKFVLALFLVANAAFLSVSASADTLTLETTGGQAVNGVYVYPYNFSVNGSTPYVSLMCLDYTREITFGETWNVTENAVATTPGDQTSIDYRALALIYANIQNATSPTAISDYQFAAWSIFDPSGFPATGTPVNAGYDANAKLIAQTALTDAANNALTPGFNYSDFFFYSPTSNTTGWTDGIPQEFMAEVSNPTPNTTPSLVPTPEPSSLLFLGTGMIGIASIVRRRFVRA